MRATYSAILLLNSRTGHGRSGLVSAAVAGVETEDVGTETADTEAPASVSCASVMGPSLPRRMVAIASPSTKRVLLAAPRGYCAGVDRAVIAVEKALELHGAPIYVRKEIVHNKFVVETLSERGAIFVNETDEVPQGARVVFSAHGVSPAVREAADQRNLLTIDATCPLVTKVHKEAVRFAREDQTILLIGHTGHEEVEGTAGEAPEHTI